MFGSNLSDVTCESHPNGDLKTPAKVILTEGLYVLNEELRDIMDVKVYVFTPIDVIKERWYKRAVSRGKTGEAADLQFRNVNETAQHYIRPTYQISDCIINGMVDKEYIKVITDNDGSLMISSFKTNSEKTFAPDFETRNKLDNPNKKLYSNISPLLSIT